VIGGGYIGLELGQGFARLGSEVHIFERGARILPSESADVGDVLREALQRDGVVIHEGTGIERVEYVRGRYRLHTGQEDHGADALLVATGRIPNTDALNVRAAGVELDERGYVKVDEQLKAGEGLYAIGEAAGQSAFTHVAWEDYRRLKDILGGGERRRDDRVLGYAVFTDPQVGRAGLSLEQAQATGYNVQGADMPVAHMARGIEWGQDLGFYRLVFDIDSNRLLGAELVGYEAGEIVHVLLDLIEAGVTAAELARWQHIHPAYAENLPSLARMIGP
jgi:pyruvate/2-oxoglutarate dehydrogenase complex dihydrolipoamide dehydrogenase (E3) component